MSQSRLARAMGYDRSYISKIESGTDWPAPDFARRADDVLAAGGALRRSYARQGTAPSIPEPPSAENADPPVLIVDHDEATLRFDGERYHATQHRRIINRGTEPVTRYLIRI